MRMLPPWLYEARAWIHWLYRDRWTMVAIFGGLFLVVIVARIVTRVCQRKRSSRGSSAWATRREIRRAGLLDGAGVVVGEIGYGWRRDYLRVGGEANVLVVGPRRRGKTSVITIKVICSDDEEALWIFDFKGELKRLTEPYRASLGPTYTFAPASTQSDHISPPDLIRWDTPDDVADADRFATALAQGEQDSPHARATSEEGQYYRRWARVILVGTVLGLHDDPQRRWPCTMRGMLSFFSQSGNSVRESLEWLQGSRDPTVQEIATLVLARTPNDQKEVFSAAAGWLFPWFDPILAHNMGDTTIPIDQLQQGPDPMTLYFQFWPDDVQGRLRPVVRFLYQQIRARITRRQTRVFRRRLRCIFEDMAEIGYFPLIENITSFDGEAGWSLLAVVQSTNQIWQKYGHDTALFDNCDTWVFFEPNHPDTAEFLAKKLGNTTVTETLEGHTRQPFSLMRASMSREQTIERPLLDPWELSHIGRKHCVVCVGVGTNDQAVKPILARARPYWQDGHFAGRVSA